MNVFFYGLFMDENRLAKNGIVPSDVAIGYIDGFRLRIGERATLQPHAGARAYGVMMNVSAEDLARLYAERSVADYVPEIVKVRLLNGSDADASCYNLPGDKVAGFNREYAEALLELATSLGLPEPYLGQIRQAVSAGP